VFRPDVLIHLPDEKHLVIDSKVSLVAYERYFNADTEEARQTALKEHLTALRNHIRELSAKNYSQLYGIDSPDFVMLFIPVEGAFSLAITSDTDLFGDAFDRKIVIVSTSTLLATLRTVSYIWRTEKQKLNVQELFAKAGDLYDKVVGFTDDMISLGAKLD
jgi:DNA recombination protein RmuC